MTRYLIACPHFLGDTLWAASIAKKLKERDPSCYVGYTIKLAQPKLLLEANPYIDSVHIMDEHSGIIMSAYDVVYIMPPIAQDKIPTVQLQEYAGITNTSSEFDIYIPEDINSWVKDSVDMWSKNKPVIAIQRNWVERAKQLRANGTYTPRDTVKIYNKLAERYTLLLVGLPPYVSQTDTASQNPDQFATTAAMIKHSDLFVGSEGGLCNVAMGVRCRSVICTGHMYQMFGPQGLMRQYETIALGPCAMYPTDGHVMVRPQADDDEFIQTVIDTIQQPKLALHEKT